MRCPSKDVPCQVTIGWMYGYGSLLEQAWKTSVANVGWNHYIGGDCGLRLKRYVTCTI